VLQMVRDVLVEAVFAGALTALVLGHGAIGLILLTLGGVLLSMVLRGHRFVSFGISR
jgi:hypothetical protein